MLAPSVVIVRPDGLGLVIEDSDAVPSGTKLSTLQVASPRDPND
jgi:hypothetical protein